MLFRFEPNPEVLWPVTIETPADGGEPVRHKVKIRYRMKKQDEVDALLASGDDSDLVRAVVVGWEDVPDTDGKPVPYSAEALEAAIAWSFVRRALVEGFFRANAGAPAKN